MKINVFSKIAKNIYAALIGIITLWQGIDFVIPRLSGDLPLNQIEKIREPTNKSNHIADNTGTKSSYANNEKKEIITPKSREIEYFNHRENLSGENSIGFLFISSRRLIHDNLQFKVSDLMLEVGINSSTSLFKGSVGYFDKFRNANKSWLAEINLKDHVDSYIVGQLSEEVFISSSNKKITVVNLTFKGRLIKLSPYQVYPINLKEQGSSFNKENALDESYNKLARIIAEKVIKITVQ
ncbi:MAG: hypothetical protein AAF363_13915 [Bacteroidota bacterium]